jgi:hypothetical protein
VWSFFVVPSKPNFQVFEKSNSCFICFQVDPFVFQGSPKPFDENIVLELPLPIHADLDSCPLERRGEGFTGKLAPNKSY